MNLFTLLAFIVFVGTMPLLVFIPNLTHQQFQKSLRMKTTQGKIMTWRNVYVQGRYNNNFGHKSYTPGYYTTRFLIRFVNDKGNLSEFESNLPQEVRNREIGDEVEVIYDPLSTDGDAGIYTSVFSRWLYVILMMVLNAAIILFPVVLFCIGKFIIKPKHFSKVNNV